MTSTISRLSRLALAFSAMSIAAFAADSAADKAKAAASSASDLQRLVQQLGAQRDSMISQHEALSKQLKDATEVQKQAILEKMAEQKKSFRGGDERAP